jgi:hypothetical protein
MNSKKIRIVVPLLMIIIVFVFFIRGCIAPIIKGTSEINLSNKDLSEKKRYAKMEYLNLFSEKVRKNLTIRDNFISKSKSPYCSYTWNNKYKIVIYKTKISSNSSLDKIVSLEKKNAFLTPNVSYKGYEETGGIKFSYSSEYDSLINNIFITYADSLTKKINLGDTVVNYNFVSNNISFRYEQKGPKDMLYLAQQIDVYSVKDPKIEMNVTLYKRGNSIYIIVVYPYLNGLPKVDTVVHELFKIYNNLYKL